MKFGIGQPVRRKEDVRLAAGRGTYTDDLQLDGQLFGFFVRSPHAHARLGNVDVSAARRAPGVIGVLTADDIAGTHTMPVARQVRNRDGSPLRVTPKTLLPHDKVRFCGEPIALIIAETPALARDAADLVAIDYEPLPACTTAADAAHAAQLWDEVPGNLSFDWTDGDETAVTKAFAAAAKIVAVDVVQNRVMASPMEPRGAIGAYDAERDRYTLYTGTQGGATVRDRIADILGVSRDKLRVVTPEVGGAFGQKIAVTVEQALVLLAAKAFGRPVKWSGSRSEAFLGDFHGRDVRMHGELALDESALILAVRVKSAANLGAWLSQAGPNITTSGGLRILGGVYRVPSAFVNVRGYVSNCAPVTAYRGAGRPEAAYIMERLLDLAAAEFKMDPRDIRRRNFLRPDELPYRNWKGLFIDSGDFAATMDAAVRASDWDGFAERRRDSERRGRLRGRGLAYYVEASGGPAGVEPCKIAFNDGGEARVIVGTQSNGQGHETVFAQLVSETLGLAFDSIKILQGDTALGVAGLNSVGSRSLQAGGGAILAAAAEVIRKGKLAAAQILQAGETPVRFTSENGVGTFVIEGGERRLSLAELAAALRREGLPGFESGLDSDGSFDAKTTFPNGCHICEVEVDRETGRLQVCSYIVVDDLGHVINPLLVEGQVHGGLAQGLGQALMEEAVYDRESGQLLTPTFVEYAVPRAEDMPQVRIQMREIPSTTNPLGSKGAGEAGTVGSLAALVCATADALGVRHIDMPMTPERVWRALQEPGTGKLIIETDNADRASRPSASPAASSKGPRRRSGGTPACLSASR